MSELLNLGLPKWPQMIVTGQSVTVDQAKNIILRTDDFLTDPYKWSGGNNHGFNTRYRKMAGLDRIKDDDWVKLLDFGAKLREEIGHIECEYVKNSWASCAFIFGPHGWCWPDGTIQYVDNVGKWPSVEDILNDWAKLATAFRYLQLNVTLMDGEGCEDGLSPVVNIRVAEGSASLEPPNLSIHESSTFINRADNALFLHLENRDREQGLPKEWVEEFAAIVKQAGDKVQNESKDLNV